MCCILWRIVTKSNNVDAEPVITEETNDVELEKNVWAEDHIDKGEDDLSQKQKIGPKRKIRTLAKDVNDSYTDKDCDASLTEETEIDLRDEADTVKTEGTED